MTLLSSTNKLIYIQCRYSRRSVVEYRKHRLLTKYFRIEKSQPDNVFEKFVKPINELVPVDSKKTTLKIDVLDEESYSKLSEWRKNKLITRARRVLPLPISLTTDDKIGISWKQKYIKSLENFNDNKNETLENSIPNFIKLLHDANPDVLKEKFPDLFEKYRSIVKSKKEEQITSENSNDLQIYLPFSQIFSPENSKTDLAQSDSNKPPIVYDQEYDNYLKHHEFLQYLASNFNFGPFHEYEPEIKAWASQVWLRNYGSSDSSIPPSNVPCSGCGAHLHCTASNIPGFVPAEKFTLLDKMELNKQLCQRCEFLKKYNIAMNVTVSNDEYPNLISKIRSKNSLVIIMVDLLDFPCSVWPGIINLIGEKHLIYIVGNKVDLLPKDDKFYLQRIKYALKESLKSSHINREAKIKDVSIISAKTGFGVDNLVTKLLRDIKYGEDIYLIGCTNAGKSTLFNVLMQSDLCALTDTDLMSRATTSIWPGTTLNLLKFPIRKLRGWEMQMRINKMQLLEKEDIAENILRKNLSRQSNIRYAHLSERLNTNLSNQSPFLMDSHHPLINTVKNTKPFNYQNKNCHYLNDTPGVIYKDQLLNLLTTEELLRTIPRETIIPRTYSLRPLQTLFIGGLARIDVCHARQHVWITVFASSYLPVNIVYTEQARKFYETHVGTEFLAVPLGDKERLKYWPKLSPKELTVNCIGWEESCADIVLSSAGWISITGNADSKAILKTFTPEGRGIYLRNPPMLPFAIKLRGKRIMNTPCFENRLYTIDDQLLRKESTDEKGSKVENVKKKLKTFDYIKDKRIKDAIKFVKG